ncbi:MAG: nitroreductase family protein, partial [Planctomycetota bacterium]
MSTASPAPDPRFAVKQAEPEFPVHPLIAARFSPYVFDPNRRVETEKIQSCLEAIRWSASSYNEQPWSFLIARRADGQEFRRMLECLVEANQAWAQHADVLM